jgi:hypothetical protein
MIAQGADMQMVLRLLCLASITGGGIKAKPLENIKREFLQAYGYHHLPLLLALSATPLSAVLTNPLPAGAPASTVVHAKYPFSQIRKQLRLLIDAEGLDELENDISYVYSGYAPLSIRLVQCIAQKGGVLSNPAEISDAKPNSDGEAKSSNKVQAHPIVGWKGFDDTVATIPGETIDVLQKTGADTKISAISTSASNAAFSVTHYCFYPSATTSAQHNHSRLLPRWMYLHRDRRLTLGGPTEPR